MDIKEVIKKEKEIGDRWEKGIEHHPKSEELMSFLQEIDFHCYGDYFCWKTGGDGDNGEALMYQLDAYFELKDRSDASGFKVLKGKVFPHVD